VTTGDHERRVGGYGRVLADALIDGAGVR